MADGNRPIPGNTPINAAAAGAWDTEYGNYPDTGAVPDNAAKQPISLGDQLQDAIVNLYDSATFGGATGMATGKGLGGLAVKALEAALPKDQTTSDMIEKMKGTVSETKGRTSLGGVLGGLAGMFAGPNVPYAKGTTLGKAAAIGAAPAAIGGAVQGGNLGLEGADYWRNVGLNAAMGGAGGAIGGAISKKTSLPNKPLSQQMATKWDSKVVGAALKLPNRTLAQQMKLGGTDIKDLAAMMRDPDITTNLNQWEIFSKNTQTRWAAAVKNLEADRFTPLDVLQEAAQTSDAYLGVITNPMKGEDMVSEFIDGAVKNNLSVGEFRKMAQKNIDAWGDMASANINGSLDPATYAVRKLNADALQDILDLYDYQLLNKYGDPMLKADWAKKKTLDAAITRAAQVDTATAGSLTAARQLGLDPIEWVKMATGPVKQKIVNNVINTVNREIGLRMRPLVETELPAASTYQGRVARALMPKAYSETPTPTVGTAIDVTTDRLTPALGGKVAGGLTRLATGGGEPAPAVGEAPVDGNPTVYGETPKTADAAVLPATPTTAEDLAAREERRKAEALAARERELPPQSTSPSVAEAEAAKVSKQGLATSVAPVSRAIDRGMLIKYGQGIPTAVTIDKDGAIKLNSGFEKHFEDYKKAIKKSLLLPNTNEYNVDVLKTLVYPKDEAAQADFKKAWVFDFGILKSLNDPALKNYGAQNILMALKSGQKLMSLTDSPAKAALITIAAYIDQAYKEQPGMAQLDRLQLADANWKDVIYNMVRSSPSMVEPYRKLDAVMEGK